LQQRHYDPRRAESGQSPLVLDSPSPKVAISTLMASETRFQLTAQQDPGRYRDLVARAQQQIERRLAVSQQLAGRAGGHP
jgi:pyruvate-ferredoxin/flavodoxin oxidoreductase